MPRHFYWKATVHPMEQGIRDAHTTEEHTQCTTLPRKPAADRGHAQKTALPSKAPPSRRLPAGLVVAHDHSQGVARLAVEKDTHSPTAKHVRT